MKDYVIKHYEIHSEKLNSRKQSIRIIFISDFHNARFGGKWARLAADLKSLHADLILIGGDIVVGKPDHDMANTKKLLSILPKDVPVYAANGNHEYRLKIYPEVYGSMYGQYRKLLDQYHVFLLENESVSLQIHGTSLKISGYELPREYYQRFYRGGLPPEKLYEVFPEKKEDAYRILLAHYPKYFETYVSWKADLILSGHYHGGIVRLGGKYPVVGNDFTLFPKYAYGYYEKKQSVMLVSAGLGEHTIPLRLLNPRELVVADIKGKR